jgi:outer membrane biosynthesis protein TonB
MVKTERDFRNGWIVSILFHAALAVLLMFLTVRQYIPEPQFVEMTWGSVASVDKISQLPATDQATASSKREEEVSNNSVALPKRKYLDLPDEVISLRARKKNITADNPVSSTRSGKATAKEQRSNVVSSGLGSKDNVVGKSTNAADAQVATPFGSGSDGGLGSNVAYDIQWSGGGSRKLVNGDMPSYPPGVNVQAQIKLKVVVLPSGSVRAVQPAQKGNTRLENAAISKVKFWQFEPLLSAQPQVEQICSITFNFELK